jgi:hypothetical protein
VYEQEVIGARAQQRKGRNSIFGERDIGAACTSKMPPE